MAKSRMVWRVMAMIVIGLAGLMALTACHGDKPASTAGMTEPLSILGRFQGSDPAFKQAGLRVFNSHDELVAIGSQYAIKPDIDYRTHSLLVLALGQKSTGGYWAYITGVQRQGDEVFVQGYANAPAPTEAVTQMVSYPYYAVLIPKAQPKIIHAEIESIVGEHLLK